MIQMIPRSKLEPHPDNPRKDLGDLTELSASIKARGVLQNLTVVPHPDKPDMYRVIIGHRRLAASELAEVEMLPCSIEEMDEVTQIATMLAENMQRNDLTLCDQVFGVQCMMNLGEDANAIAGKTGLSATTIRKRMKLTHLDPKGLEQAEKRGATLLDLAKVANLEDPAAREKVLANLGTPNFAYELKKAQDAEKARKMVPEALKLLPWAKAMSRDEFNHQMRYFEVVRYIYADGKDPDYSRPDDPEDTEYVVTYTDSNTQLCIYRMYPEEEANKRKAENAARRARQQEHSSACQQMKKRTRELREQFIREKLNVQNTDPEAICEMITEAIAKTDLYSTFDRSIPDDIMRGKPDKGMTRAVVYAWFKLEGNHAQGYDDWRYQFSENRVLDALYGCLEKLGYQISDEEHEWMTGTHPCFDKEGT